MSVVGEPRDDRVFMPDRGRTDIHAHVRVLA